MKNYYTDSEIKVYLKSADCYKNFNYYFACSIDKKYFFNIKTKDIGYILNQTNNGIYLLPIKEDLQLNKFVDIENSITIAQNEIKLITIKNKKNKFKQIIIRLKDKTKYKLKTPEGLKKITYHKKNLEKFIEIYK